MSAQAPPYPIALAVEQSLPGFWRAFLSAANAGFEVAASGGATVGISSWWRDAEHNRAVGGHPRSQHLLGLAFDLESDQPDLAAEAFRAQGFTVVESPSHVHVQTFPAGALDRIFAF